MLQSLSIKNVALITNLNIEFGKGLNVLLGETGAGKSIIFDALNFVLGDKADKTLIRSGENEMRVDAFFGEISPYCQSQLKELGFDGDEIGLQRVLTKDGKSSARINGIPVVAGLLKEIGAILVDSYSQHESIELLKTKNHLSMLDRYGGEEITSAKEKVKAEHDKLKEIESKIEKLGGDQFDRERRKSLLEFQINEIEGAALNPEEDEGINDKLHFYENAERIQSSLDECLRFLSEEDGSAINQINMSISALSSVKSFDNIEELRSRLESALIELEDIAESIRDIAVKTVFDEREYEALDKRRDLIKSLMKKYGNSIDSILNYLENIKTEYDELLNSDVLIQNLEKEKENTYKILEGLAFQLSTVRQKFAKEIEGKIMRELADLAMKSSRFEVAFSKTESIHSNGFDDVEFVFSANKGQEVRSLAKTASGGELSRFMLAIKNIFAQVAGAQTLIFDEIDAGISGETGKAVGLKLSNITKNAQVICITHLPQVACYGDDFYVVAKREDKSSTITEVKHLSEGEINESIARMMVGNDLSQTALNQVAEMRAKAGKIE